MRDLVCYFCNSTTNLIGYCAACGNKYDLHSVYTDYIHDGDFNLKLCYAAIQLDINDINYSVVFRFLDEYTSAVVNETAIYQAYTILFPYGKEAIITLPGYPFTLSNVKDKLKTYLVLS
jgi:hypothetical protein